MLSSGDDIPRPPKVAERSLPMRSKYVLLTMLTVNAINARSSATKLGTLTGLHVASQAIG